MKDLRVIKTEDGSSTIYNPALRETYHSTHGAITESRYVFIEKGLDYFLLHHSKKEPVNVFEVGFGTGLNAVLAFHWAVQNKRQVYYESIEAFPLSNDIVNELNYFQSHDELRAALINLHNLNWEKKTQLSEYFEMLKVHRKIQDYLPQYKFDIVFFDAFAPSKQSEMWDKDILAKIIDMLSDRGVFVTYCAKGQLKRDLKELGCEVETLPGPPGKKEMVRAVKPG